MLKPILSLCVTVITTVSLTACNSNSSSDGQTRGAFPTIGSQNVSANGCLNMSLLQERLASGSYPTLAVTTDFRADSSLGTRKELFHTYSAFDVRDMATNEIAFLVNPIQADCSEIRANTVSGEQFLYKITSTTENSITFEINKPANEEISSYRLKALKKKMHPTKYKVEILSPTHLRVQTTYRGFDAHCRGSKPMTSTVQRDYIWDRDGNFPGQIQIKDSFYQKVVSTLKSGSDGSFTPLPPIPQPQPVEQPQPQPAPELPAPTDPSIPVSPADPASSGTSEPGVPETQPVPETPANYNTPTVPGLPGSPEAPILPRPASFVVLNQVELNSDYRTIDLSELRSLVTQPAKDEIVKCTR